MMFASSVSHMKINIDGKIIVVLYKAYCLCLPSEM